ncbi:protein Shroom1 isoform X2 [Meriones unguiculatus]|uniref:protein Shroom1 isoform X2 n=1 Tax=Meriones unguiculatus TaxID=10047 RepID=UPI00293F6652|nr:protein Shroom1 isoform X2 [Meriones unguiculatus]
MRFPTSRLVFLSHCPCHLDLKSFSTILRGPPVPNSIAMEALGTGSDRASPASAPGSLDLRRLSTRADSAYSSFSAASAGPETRTPSPGSDPLPYLDWDYVRVVWGGRSPTPQDAVLLTTQRPGATVAGHGVPRPPEKAQGSPGAPLSRQDTPLLYALAAEAEAAARPAEPPSPPASRDAYRQRLQGAQRRVLRETSFQRKELRMSLPGRLRPALPARPPSAHARSASGSQEAPEAEPARTAAPAPGAVGRGRLTSQQRLCCFSEPGKLHRVGWGGGPTAEGLRGACSTQELQREALSKSKGLQETQSLSSVELSSGSVDLGNTCRPAGRSQSVSGEVMAPRTGSERTVAAVQAVPQKAETPRPWLKTKLFRFLTQKEAAVGCPGEALQTRPAGCGQRVSETRVSTPCPSLPDDDVFLEEAETPSPQDRHAPQGLSVRDLHTPDQQYENGVSKKAGQTTGSAETPLHEVPGLTGADNHWQGVNGSVVISRPISRSPPETTNDDIPPFDAAAPPITDPSSATDNNCPEPVSVDVLQPSGPEAPGTPHHSSLAWGQPGSKPTWPSRHFEELVQELARLDPALSETLAAQPGPEPPQGLLDGLFPATEAWTAMRPACEEDGEKDAGGPEVGACGCRRLSQELPTSQEASRSENSSPHPVPDRSSGQGFPEQNSTQAKKDLHTEQERLRGTAADWTGRSEDLEAAVSQACTPRELERFRRFMTDLERVLGLLLLLGSRLARVHLALARAGPDSDPDERASLLQRLRLLQRQQEDAKELKEHVARREQALRQVLERELPAEQLRSYCVLLAAKARILSQQRSLDDRVRFLKEQLDTIWNDLSHHPPFPRLSWAPGIRPLGKPPFPATHI